MSVITKYLRTPQRELTPGDALTKHVSILLGVSDEAVAALKNRYIETVFDLATSNLFGTSYKILQASDKSQSEFAFSEGFSPSPSGPAKNKKSFKKRTR